MQGKLNEIAVLDFLNRPMSPEFYAELGQMAKQVKVVNAEVDFSGVLTPAHLRNCEAILIRVFDNFDFLAAAAPRLRYVGSCHTDLSHLPVEALLSRGVTVTNVPKYAADSVAELTIGMLISMSRSIPAALAHVKSGGWDVESFIGHALSGKTIGIVGLGAIGGRVAAAAHALNLRVLSCHGSSKNLDYVDYAPLSEIFSRSDAIVMSCPLTSRTFGMIGRELIRTIRPGCSLLVPARSELLDCGSVYERCRNGELLVWFDELHDRQWRDNFRRLPHAFLTPDFGWLTYESLARQEAVALENLRDWLSAGRYATKDLGRVKLYG